MRPRSSAGGQERPGGKKRAAAKRGAHLVYLDESGFMLTPTVRRTYAPRGDTPVHKAWGRHDRISAISAITVSPRRQHQNLYFRLLPTNQNVHGEDTVLFLRTLRRHIGKAMTLVWDKGRVHKRSRVVRDYLAKNPQIKPVELPGYAPDLNPDEQVWQHTKYSRLSNFSPRDARHLRRRVRYELNRLKKRPALLGSFIRYARRKKTASISRH
jgi:transposase